MNNKSLILFLSIITSSTFAQNWQYTQLRDFYPMISNVDSLEKVVYSYKKDSLRYLQGLIKLEYCRRINSDKFGQDFEKIRTLSEKLHYPLGTAINNLNQAKEYRSKDIAKSFMFTQNALKYFESTKDTTGIISALYQLIILNIDEFKQKKGDIKIAKQLFKRMVNLGENSSFINDKIAVKLRTERFRDQFDKPFTEQQQITFYKELEALIQKVNPIERRAYYELFYQNKGGYFMNQGKNEKALEYYKKSVGFCDYCSPSILATSYTNIGELYNKLEDYPNAKTYFEKVVDISSINTNKNSPIFINAYDSYATILFKMGAFKDAWKYRNVKDSLEKIYNEKANAKVFFDLQAKYETEKKESTIKTLELEKKAIDSQKWLLIIGLLMAVIVGSVVSFLLFRLRKTNADLVLLQKARDKLYTIIAHDLRSPLNTYQRYSEIVGYLIKTKQFDRLDNTLKKIDETGLHLASLLNNLLQWSIAQQKNISYAPQKLQFKKLLDELLPIYRDMANLKAVNINELIDENIELQTDPNALSLIIRNLLDNAIKYTPEGEQVFLTSYFKNDEFIFCLKNKGNLMSDMKKNKIKKLFESNQNYNFGEDGLGIGLILVKQYAQINRTKVKFEIEQSEWTTFRLFIPQVLN